MGHILIVDDDQSFRSMLADSLRAVGYTVNEAANGEKALAMTDGEPDLAFVDLRMDGKEDAGLQTLRALKERFPALPVILITAFGDVQTAVAAMKAGALDFIEKPVNIDAVRQMASAILTGEDDAPEPEQALLSFGGIVPSAGPMSAAVRLMEAAAETQNPVLITGESGTGKELAASFIHENSPRRSGPFVRVNCSAIPDGLIETEMFGCVAGAFTGAGKAREGRFAAAKGGTLFLDEIAEMDSGLQAKLLRVLQEKEFEPVGSNRPVKADVRIVAATNRPVQEALVSGQLREDLYYRISLFHVHLPPLRERIGDIIPLAGLFLSMSAEERPARLSPEAQELLRRHRWPGNIRELFNTVERARILSRGGVIRAAHLPFDEGEDAPPQTVPLPSAVIPVQAMEQQLIMNALRETDGNRTEAAKRLGMSRRALLYKLKRYGIS